MQPNQDNSRIAQDRGHPNVADRAAKIAREIANLNHAYSLHRQIAAVALGQLGDRSAVPALICALSDPTSDVRMSAAVALGQINDLTAIPALVRALDDHRHGVRQCTRQALRQMGNADTLPLKVIASAQISVAERITILRAMGRARFQQGGMLIYEVLPIRGYCQSLLKRRDVADGVRIGASEILTYLELVRQSDRDPARDAAELPRAASLADDPSDELVRAANGPPEPGHKPVSPIARIRVAWDKLMTRM